jgi:outer membrane protein
MQRVPLTLAEAISKVLENNKEIVAARIEVSRADLNYKLETAAYDARFSLLAFTERRVTPVSSILGGAADGKLTESDTELTPQYDGFMPWGGGSYKVGLSGTRQSSNNFYVPLDAQYPTRLDVSIVQPLMRGLHADQRRWRIEVARKNRTLSDNQLRQRIVDIVVETERYYWDLVAAYTTLQIQAEARDLSKQLLEANQRQTALGERSAIEVVEARKQLESAEDRYDETVQSVTRAENALKAMLAGGLMSPVWAQTLEPRAAKDEMERLGRMNRPINDLVQTALENREELTQNDTERQINEIDARYYRDRLRPQVDVEASYGAQGLSGQIAQRPANPLLNADLSTKVNQLAALAGVSQLPAAASFGVPSLFIGGIGQSGINLAAQRFPAVRAGLRIELPLHNHQAETQVALAANDSQRIKNRRDQLQLKIAAEVRDAAQALHTAQVRLEKATSMRSLAAELFESEKRKFREGVSTVFLVLQRQNALIDSQMREAQSRTELYRRLSDADRATGTTLEAHAVSIQH